MSKRFVDFLANTEYSAERFVYVRIADLDKSALTFTLNDFILSMLRRELLTTLYKPIVNEYDLDGFHYIELGGKKR